SRNASCHARNPPCARGGHPSRSGRWTVANVPALTGRDTATKVRCVSVVERDSSAGATDNWDRHWTSYAAATERNPAQSYRRKLVFELLDLAAARGPVRVL